MELLSKTETIVRIVESRVQLDNGNVVVVKDHYDGRKIIDTQVRTKDGYEIEDPVEVEAVLNFLDQQE